MLEFGLSKCDILKIADNELEFMTEVTDFYKGAAILQKNYPNITGAGDTFYARA